MRAGASWGNFFVYTPTNTWKLLIQASIEVIFFGFVTGSIHKEGAVSLAAFWTVIWYWLSKTWFVRSEPKSTYSWPQILVRNLSDKRASTDKLTDWNNWPGMWGAVLWDDCCGRPVMAAASFCRLPCTIFLAKASTGVGAILSAKGPAGTSWRSDVGTGGVGAGANRRETSSATLFTRVSINWLDNRASCSVICVWDSPSVTGVALGVVPAGAPLAAPADAAVLALTLARGLARVLDGPAAGLTWRCRDVRVLAFGMILQREKKHSAEKEKKKKIKGKIDSPKWNRGQDQVIGIKIHVQ